MVCHRCLLLEKNVSKEEESQTVIVGPNVGPAITILNGEALCLRHWQDAIGRESGT